MPLTPPPHYDKPILMEDKCIFHLHRRNELTGKYKPPRDFGTIKRDNHGRFENTSNSTRSYVNFEAKSPINTDNGFLYSISLFAKKSIDSIARYQEFGFFFRSDCEQNCGYYGRSGLYADDSSTSATYLGDIQSYIVDPLGVYFYTFCRDIDGTVYASANGKMLPPKRTTTSIIRPIEEIYIFNGDGDNSFCGWIDEVIIHRDICLYKEDFIPPEYNEPPEITAITDDIKIY